MRSGIPLLLLLVATCACTKTSVRVFRTYHLSNIEQPAEEKVADITILKESIGDASAELDLVFESIIDSSVFENLNDNATLSFRGPNIDMQYTIRHSDVLQSNYKEIINLVLSHDSEVVGFNYFQEKLKKKEHKSVSLEVVPAEQGKEHVFTYSMLPPKATGPQAVQEEQSFFSKYKWYIIGAVAVFYVISNVDPEKANEMARQAQAQKKS